MELLSPQQLAHAGGLSAPTTLPTSGLSPGGIRAAHFVPLPPCRCRGTSTRAGWARRSQRQTCASNWSIPSTICRRAELIVVGGGNTFQLLRECRRRGFLPSIRSERVKAGMRYLGWSAGANLACPTIKTTNDMPIVDPGCARRARAGRLPDQSALPQRRAARPSRRDARRAPRGVRSRQSEAAGDRAAGGRLAACVGFHSRAAADLIRRHFFTAKMRRGRSCRVHYRRVSATRCSISILVVATNDASQAVVRWLRLRQVRNSQEGAHTMEAA